MTALKKIKDLPVKTQWKMLLGLIGLLYIISYQFNIKRTIQIMSSYKQLLRVVDTLPPASTFSKNEMQFDQENTEKETQSLLDSISNFSEQKNIKVKEISQSFSQTPDTYAIETNKIILEGTYQNTLELINDLENEKRVASVNSASWDLFKDKTNNDRMLLTTLYIKHIKYGKAK